jgi:micrococcal nuclease
MMPKIALVLIFLIISLDIAYATTATVITVYDGDTLSAEVQGTVVNLRLYGIDAPESGQGGNVTATRFLMQLVLGHPLEIKVIDTDRFGRPLALVIRKGKASSVNAAMVGNGYAWVNPDQCKVDDCTYWKELESQARKLKLGIWSGYDLVPPWEFSRQNRQ